LSKQFGIENPA